MRVFAISDLHLGSNVEKPMDVFGPEWAGHEEKITENWRKTVGAEDLVLLPGDLSWAMKLEEAIEDLRLIESLPGHKVFIRGNHDYWFAGPGKVRRRLGKKLDFVRFDARVYKSVGVCGVRGWPWPGYGEYEEERDLRHYRKELDRLALSLDALSKLQWHTACAMVHYPPLTEQCRSEFCSLLQQAGVRWVVYGHLHGLGAGESVEGRFGEVNYACVSADYLGFMPKLVFDTAGL